MPEEIRRAVAHLNQNFITEIRLRVGLPVIVDYHDEYYYLYDFGVTRDRERAIICGEIASIINAVTGGSIYSYAEQIKSGFITGYHGVRIGLAGEYVMQNNYVNTIANITSLNIRIAHDIVNCAKSICTEIFDKEICSVLLFSKPGMGKTTKLRDIARFLSEEKHLNVLIFDERSEICGLDWYGNGFQIGDRIDVIRSGNKLVCFQNAIRAMKPDVIITDELYGEGDNLAVNYAAQCGIAVIASSHITDKETLRKMPFKYFVELKSVFGQPIIYDKNFNSCGSGGIDDIDRGFSAGE